MFGKCLHMVTSKVNDFSFNDNISYTSSSKYLLCRSRPPDKRLLRKQLLRNYFFFVISQQNAEFNQSLCWEHTGRLFSWVLLCPGLHVRALSAMPVGGHSQWKIATFFPNCMSIIFYRSLQLMRINDPYQNVT